MIISLRFYVYIMAGLFNAYAEESISGVAQCFVFDAIFRTLRMKASTRGAI